jgi:hypothetical protein
MLQCRDGAAGALQRSIHKTPGGHFYDVTQSSLANRQENAS